MEPQVYSFIVAGAASLIVFTLRQLKLDEPLLDVRVFKYPMYSIALFMFLIVMMSMFSSEIILPMFMQGPLGLTAAAAGLILLPGALLNGLMSPVMGKLFDKFGPRKLIIPAAAVLTATMFSLSQVSEHTPVYVIIISYILLMLSVSAIMMPAQTNGLNQLPKRLYPHGTAIMNTLQPVAGAIGVSVFISILTTREESALNQMADPGSEQAVTQAMVLGVELVYFVAFAVALAGFVLSLFVKRARPVDLSNETTS